MFKYIYYILKNYNKIYIMYNVLFWGIYIISTFKKYKKIKNDWIIV